MSTREHHTAFVFPGQGSQHPRMGKDIAEASAAARLVFEQMDDALDFSITRLCFEGPEDDLKLTANTQPAILTVSIAILAALRERSAVEPDIVAGHSLGEYSAIVAAGGLKAADALKIVRNRGLFMQDAVPVGQGAMAAILGPSLEEIEQICAEASEGEVVSPANINAPGQIVIAGTKGAVDRAIAIAKGRGVRRALPLPVSAPFHCALMKPAEERLAPILEAATFHPLYVPLVTNVDASPVGTEHAVRNALIRQVVSPVRWVESVQKMIEMGVRRFVEVGPGSVLTGLIKRIDPSVELVNVNDAASLDVLGR
ncbi:MAG TPA: ACP S-malonyltransferase [Thermoanaerobaculia bacterium]|nr:ACP S-malonyltransferase [Thermoanaerobaculia bacterium]